MKLFSLLSELSDEKYTALNKFLNSPYHNNRKLVTKYFNIIKPFAPDFSDKKLEDTRIFKKLFQGEEFKPGKIHKIRSYLVDLIEEFLVLEELKSNGLMRDRVLANVYLKNNLEYILTNDYQRFSQNLKEVKESRTAPLGESLQFQLTDFFQPYTGETKLDKTRFKSLATTYKKFELLTKLKLSIENFNQHKTGDSEIMISLQNEDIENLKKLFGEDKRIKIYIRVYEFLLINNSNSDVTDYLNELRAIRKLIDENREQFSLEEQRALSQTLINWTARYLKTDDNIEIKREQFEFFKTALAEELLIKNGLMSKISFYNIVVLVAELEDWEWLSEFRKKYENSLHQKGRQKILDLSRAAEYFKRKEFSNAKEILDVIKFKDINFKIIHLSLKTRVYFDLLVGRELDIPTAKSPLIELDDLLKPHTGHPKLQSYFNFIKRLIQLFYKLKENHKLTLSEKEDLIREIVAEDVVAKQWLIQKIKEL